ncbi:MAG: apolipoprotein N-acyltransferase [Janthinobacterium lividum]
MDHPVQGWRAKALAYVYGLVAALALAPLYIFPCLIISFSGLLLLTQHTRFRQSFWLGWWFGFGYFTAGLYWIAFAMGVDLARFAWMIPFSVFGLPAFLSFFIAPVLGLLQVSNLKGLDRLILFAALWAIFEWLRGHLLTGFPWNLISYCCIDYLYVAQSFALFGAYGVSFLTILWSGAFFLWPRYKTIASVYTTFILIVMYGGLTMEGTPEDNVTPFVLRIVQPSIPQKLKSSSQHAEQNLEKIIDLTNTPAQGPAPDVYLWPESATSFLLANDNARRHKLMHLLNSQRPLLTGVTRILRTEKIKLWNSLIAINPQGGIMAHYDKSHLVPFGEYLPLRSILSSFVQKITPGSVDYSPGLGLKTLKVSNLPPFSPLICYEVIFPGKVKSLHDTIKPEWILNITNDAWYGNTSGPYQHLAIAQARAIEEGLPLIRVGNNGISASIDAYGRLTKTLALNQVGVLDVNLSKPRPNPTLYGRYGDKMFLILLAIAMGILIVRRSLIQKNKFLT